MANSTLLPALGHALSGAGGTAISTITTYPLDLVNTRLKVQRQLCSDGSLPPDQQYSSVLDAIRTIYATEGGLAAFYAGLGSDVAKSVADSFLFFLFYTILRNRRLSRGAGRAHLPAAEELAIGAAAGACSRLLTTPIANVVTRKQTAAVTDSGDKGARELVGDIVREKGVSGLWAGYSAALVLTLNPSITFFLDHALQRSVARRRRGERVGNGAGITFLLAAVSKATATAVTYPFQTAKARAQVSAPEKGAVELERRGDVKGETVTEVAAETAKAAVAGVNNLVHDTVFGTIARIVRTEGVGALYDGISGELLKAFLNHGTTMLSKDMVHKLVMQLYFVVAAALKKLPAGQAVLLQRSRDASSHLRSWMPAMDGNQTVEAVRQSTRQAVKDGEGVVVNMLGRSQRSVKDLG